MKIIGIIWLEEFVDKLASKHRVAIDEVEQVFSNHPDFKRMNKGLFRDEDVYRALGQTEAGRYLAVFFVYKKTGEALVLSARDMDHKERRSYAR